MKLNATSSAGANGTAGKTLSLADRITTARTVAAAMKSIAGMANQVRSRFAAGIRPRVGRSRTSDSSRKLRDRKGGWSVYSSEDAAIRENPVLSVRGNPFSRGSGRDIVPAHYGMSRGLDDCVVAFGLAPKPKLAVHGSEATQAPLNGRLLASTRPA